MTEFLSGLGDGAFLALPWLFEFWALPHQIAPDGAWRTWVIMGGRGAGKTRAGAEWVRGQVEGAGPADPGRARRVALVGETVDQVREVMVFGESGILACAPPDRRPIWEAGRKRLIWPNGAVAQVVSAHDPESLRGPQFDAAWADEYGCPAIDRGTNQPNLFFDAASSEGAVPRASTGLRDDLVQMQYYRAIASYWGQAGKNPVSPVHGGPMIDMDHAHAWAWDARPFPAFPLRGDIWADGPNHARGHWLNGRVTAQPADAVAAEIAERAGLDAVSTDGMQGLVRGYAVAEVGTARAVLQPLMLACGFDATEQGGALAFRSRSGRVDVALDKGRLVAGGATAPLALSRGPAADAAGRLRVGYPDAGGDFRRLVAEAQQPSGADAHVMDQEVPVALLPDEAQQLAERWLAEAQVARDMAEFALPLSALPVGVGDVVALDGRRWRIDRLEQAEALRVEAVRVDPGVHVPGPSGAASSVAAPFTPAAPVLSLFLDLPLMGGQEVPHAPHVAATADPWPGRVAVWGADGADGFALDTVLPARAVIGVTQAPLAAARTGIWDRGAAVPVRFVGGAVSAAAQGAVLNGANLAAIGDGSPDAWELFQFSGAELVGPDTWALSMRLRGLAGTDAAMPAVWPAGSAVVLMTPAVRQVGLSAAARGLERVWRIGAASRGVNDEGAQEWRLAFAGSGLRPLSVAHLKARGVVDGTEIAWVRRSRVDADSWASVEVPLGEEREAYVVRVALGTTVLRTAEVAEPRWFYPRSQQQADGAGVTVSVAQLSARFGAGPFRSVMP